MTIPNDNHNRSSAFNILTEPATHVILHGTADELTAVISAGKRAGWTILAQLPPMPCDDCSCCQTTALLVIGTLSMRAITAVSTRAGVRSGPPAYLN